MTTRYFNPSLVRLARSGTWLVKWSGCSFQSQLGSIGACHRGGFVACRSKFQSQLGSIGAARMVLGSNNSASFQSQLGSIGANWALVDEASVAQISIPALFDWRKSKAAPTALIAANFNPSLVRLARAHRQPNGVA